MKPTKIFFLISTSIMLICSLLNGQNGVLSGKIIDKTNGEAIIGAIVRTEDNKYGTTCDYDGNYRLSLPQGNYNIKISYLSYKEMKVNIDVIDQKNIVLDAALESTSTEMEEVVITYTIQKSSTISQLIERRNSAVVSDGLSSEQIRKTPDRTASDALKRVTGSTIQEGKFAIIRGMNDRYNSGYLDGSMLPSTESDRKAFAFDILPASLIDKIQIIKSGSPDLSGDFGGGLIKINTKAIPEITSQSLNLGLNIHSLTTFNSFINTSKTGPEYLGFLNSDRVLPSIKDGELRLSGSFASENDKIKLANRTKDFDLSIRNKTISAMPNSRFSYSLGKPFQLSNNNRLGLIFALNYSDTKKFQKAQIANFDGSGQTTNLQDNSYSENINTGGLLNLNFHSKKTQIGFNNLLNLSTDYSLVRRTGLGNINDYIEVDNTVQLINQNRLSNHNLNIRQIIGDNALEIQSSIHYGNIRRNIPSYKIISYTKNPDYNQYQLAIGDFFNSSTGIFSSQLNENYSGINLDLSKKLEYKKLVTVIKAGAGIQNRNRIFESKNFVLNGQLNNVTMNIDEDLSKDNIGAQKLYLVDKTSNDLAYYTGDQFSNFSFLSIDQKYSNKFRINYGIRNEYFKSEVMNQVTEQNIALLKKSNFLPSINFCYLLKEKTNLRASYYASVNRPEFRELAPFAFYTFDKNAEIRGNNKLQIAELHNFDLRAEFFPTGSQVLSIGVFYKSILNPIEFNIDITQIFTTFTYSNEKSAKVAGIELEARKNLGFINHRNVFKEISILANFALIKSSLDFFDGSKSSLNRPLQGQSPYVINVGAQYESERTGWSLTLLANRFGRRIAFVGVDPNFGATRQDIYEAPRTVVDLQIGKSYKKFNFKFTLGDILAQDLIYYQDANLSGKFENTSDRRLFLYKNGFNSNLNISYNF